MQDPFTYFKSLFQKSETSTAGNPFIHELITRSEEEKADFEFWKKTLVAQRLLDWLSDQYAVYQVAPERVDEAINFLNTPSSKGFAIQFHYTEYSKRHVTHLFDWLKLDSDPYDDLVLLAGHVCIDSWESGKLAQMILDKSIKEFGVMISDDMDYDFFDGDMHTGDLNELQYFIDSLGGAELLLMDQVLWMEMK
jgi:hypothetical protein